MAKHSFRIHVAQFFFFFTRDQHKQQSLVHPAFIHTRELLVGLLEHNQNPNSRCQHGQISKKYNYAN